MKYAQNGPLNELVNFGAIKYMHIEQFIDQVIFGVLIFWFVCFVLLIKAVLYDAQLRLNT